MEGIDLSGGSPKGCYTFRGVLSGARLVDADLSGADLTGAAAEHVDFTRARNRPPSVQEALVEPFVVRERR